MIKRFFNISITILITYLCIELVCMLFMHTKFKASPRPSFSWQREYKNYDFPFAEINPVWGMWHYPGHTTARGACFQVDYFCNNYGARDKERIMNSDTNRFIVLGDSFIEGYGIQESDRFSNQLEENSGKPALNFGCGYFTPTQELLVYENLAGKFSHNQVIIGILPFNDFSEDDSSFHEQDGFVHYQPFFEGTFPNYTLMYREDSLSKSTFNKEGYYAIQNSSSQKWRRFLKSFTYWYNLYHYLRATRVANKQPEAYSGYFDFKEKEIQKLSYILGRLKQAAGNREVWVLTIPVKQDFMRSRDGNSPLHNRMLHICDSLNLRYVDLLRAYKKLGEPPESLYLQCDGHWNEKANKLAAQIVLPLLRKQ